MAVHFHELKISAYIRNKKLLKEWIAHVIANEKASIDNINIIFTSDNELKALNKKYLSKDSLTDTITFDYSENQKISGDIFISIPRVQENAAIYHAALKHELKRVIIHGILHLLGYDDKNPEQQSEMKRMEDLYLLESPEI